jgi:uncharacterized protein
MLPSLTRWLKVHNLVAFFALTFLISWSTWFIVILTLPEMDMKNISAGGMLLMIIGQWGPALSAITLTALTSGIAGFKELFGRFKYRRGAARWILVGVCLWTAIWLAATIWQARVTNQALVFQGNRWTSILSLTISALPLFFWGCEEIGWRGFALPHLLTRWNALISSIVLGLLWGLWHLPMFVGIKGLTPEMPFYTYVLFTVSISIVMTWLFNHTQGSLLVATIFHFWFNKWPNYQYNLLPVDDPGGHITMVSFLLMSACAILIVVVCGYRSFNRTIEKASQTRLAASKA